jgi:hypothetical protein
MNEDDPIALTLFIVGGGDEKAHIEADQDQNQGRPFEPGHQPTRKGVEGGR